MTDDGLLVSDMLTAVLNICTQEELNDHAEEPAARAPHCPYTDTIVKIRQNTATGRNSYSRKMNRAYYGEAQETHW